MSRLDPLVSFCSLMFVTVYAIDLRVVCYAGHAPCTILVARRCTFSRRSMPVFTKFARRSVNVLGRTTSKSFCCGKVVTVSPSNGVICVGIANTDMENGAFLNA
jgi:hypothetical protein